MGFRNSVWKLGNVKTIRKADMSLRIPWNERKHLLYINYAIHTNSKERNKYYDFFKDIPGVFIVKERVDYETYFRHLGNSKFVLRLVFHLFHTIKSLTPIILSIFISLKKSSWCWNRLS